MFGLFDGFFGEGLIGDAAEAAMEMCLLDEMEEDEMGNLLEIEDEEM